MNCSSYDQIHFVVASDDIELAREHFPAELHPMSTFLTERRDPVVDLTALALCDHTVLSVGSFGWWIAFLRESRRVASSFRSFGTIHTLTRT